MAENEGGQEAEAAAAGKIGAGPGTVHRREIQYKYLTPLIYAPMLPVIRIALRKQPALRSRCVTPPPPTTHVIAKAPSRALLSHGVAQRTRSVWDAWSHCEIDWIFLLCAPLGVARPQFALLLVGGPCCCCSCIRTHLQCDANDVRRRIPLGTCLLACLCPAPSPANPPRFCCARSCLSMRACLVMPSYPPPTAWQVIRGRACSGCAARGLPDHGPGHGQPRQKQGHQLDGCRVVYLPGSCQVLAIVL